MHAFMQQANRKVTIPINSICNANSKHFRLCNHIFWLFYLNRFVYILASYLNKVGVSFLWVDYGLSLHAASKDCAYFYKHISNIQ